MCLILSLCKSCFGSRQEPEGNENVSNFYSEESDLLQRDNDQRVDKEDDGFDITLVESEFDKVARDSHRYKSFKSRALDISGPRKATEQSHPQDEKEETPQSSSSFGCDESFPEFFFIDDHLSDDEQK